MKKKRVKNQKKTVKFDIRKTLPYKILFIQIIILGVLGAAMIFIGIVGGPYEKRAGLKGELFDLKWNPFGNNIILDLVNYTVSNDNSTMEVIINWSSGEGELSAVLFIISESVGNCNYTSSNLPELGNFKAYNINIGNTNCFGDFDDVSGVNAVPGIDVVVEQLGDFNNITLNKNENASMVFDLNDYFNCNFGNTYFTTFYDNSNIDIDVNSGIMDVYPAFGWTGEVKVTVSGICLNFPEIYLQDSFYVIVSNPPSINTAPRFLYDCDDLEQNMNTELVIYMPDCFEDDDNDNLTYRYDSVDGNISDVDDSDPGYLILTPDTGWSGWGKIYIYANDSKEETRGRVDFQFLNTNISITNNTDVGNYSNISSDNTTTVQETKITGFDPVSSKIYIFPAYNRTFSIEASNYDTVTWYLDQQQISEGELSYDFGGLEKGNHTVTVRVQKGPETDSKTWEIVIEEDAYIERPAFQVGEVIFYLIIVIFIIIMILIIWLFILENNKERQRVSFGFGVSKVRSKKGKKSDLDFLNIPR